MSDSHSAKEPAATGGAAHEAVAVTSPGYIDSRVEAGADRWYASSSPPYPSMLDNLFAFVRESRPHADLDLLERAFNTAEKYHYRQQRRNGDAYITHPVAVATILAELGMTEPTLIAALLHDTVEDTDYTLEELIQDFGEEVALLVDGCTKVDKIKTGESANSETIRKMVILRIRDSRVLVIKLADRLHNMRTLHYLAPDKQIRIATQTLEIFAPLAQGLGVYAIKGELEDLAFKTLHPRLYDDILRLVAESTPRRSDLVWQIVEEVQVHLKNAEMTAVVSDRQRTYYSIYQKMAETERGFLEILDLVRVRVVLDTVAHCYAALRVLNERWTPLPARYKDYIAAPKFNMYQSLHATVLGPEGRPIELQIRTEEMHRRAEFGAAAPWKSGDRKDVSIRPEHAD